jgi:hypothetical protein
MKERPILFHSPLVRAILDGSKTQTRRIVKGACNHEHLGTPLGAWGLSAKPYIWDGDESDLWRLVGRRPKVGEWVEQWQTAVDDHACGVVTANYGVPGDRLWVRETVSFSTPTIPLGKIPTEEQHELFPDIHCWYQADNDRPTWAEAKWFPSIHMPRWASRITLGVTGVRVERLNEISESDAIAEGVINNGTDGRPGHVHRSLYRDLWESSHGPGSWDANPFVWVIEFKRVTP